jgi:ABC-type polysaccharide/polyol phosphate transport system ATPase subunit
MGVHEQKGFASAPAVAGRLEPYAMEVEHLSKAYRRYRRPMHRVIEATSFGRIKRHEESWALKDVSFGLRKGSSLGLVGANGAGKSTLLKTLAGVTTPTEGRFRIHGRVASLLELGAGFHMDFTGRANIVLNGVMMGFSRREMLQKTEEIIEFAELGEYIDEPVRTYSSGMGLRLGFAVAVAVDPDVLIIDEVFAVGDMYFQKKCVDKIYEFKQKGKTILFCSHSLYDVRQLCDEAIWLKQGVPQILGESVYVTNEYATFQRTHIGELEDSLTDSIPTIGNSIRSDGPGGGPAMPEILDARIYEPGTDTERYEINTGDGIEIRIWWKNPNPELTPAHLGVVFMRADMTTCAAMGTHLEQLELEGTEGCAVLRIDKVNFLASQFLVPVLLLDKGGIHKYQQFLMPENLVVRTNSREVGLFRVSHDWELDARHERPTLAAAEAAPEAAPDEGQH